MKRYCFVAPWGSMVSVVGREDRFEKSRAQVVVVCPLCFRQHKAWSLRFDRVFNGCRPSMFDLFYRGVGTFSRGLWLKKKIGAGATFPRGINWLHFSLLCSNDQRNIEKSSGRPNFFGMLSSFSLGAISLRPDYLNPGNIGSYENNMPHLCMNNEGDSSSTTKNCNNDEMFKLSRKKEKKRILILMSDTGGGHRASAEALRAAFDDLYPNQVDTVIVDLWTQIVQGPFRNLPRQYMFLQRNPTLWKLTWIYGAFPLSRCITEEFSYWIAHERVKKAFLLYRPDIIVSVHPLCQTLPLRVLRDMGIRQKIPFATVVTDLGSAHPLWFHKDVDICFVPTTRVQSIALKCGIAPNKIRQYGLPVRPAFWKESRDKCAVRQELSLQQAPTILVVGGGDGVSGVGQVSRAIACRLSEELSNAQLVIICGRNTQLQAELSRIRWPVSVYIKGFVTNMSEWMAASDCIITKAGPGTIAEALIRGLPIFLYGFLPGQEAGNVPFVVENRVGFYEKDPLKLANEVIKLFKEESYLSQISLQAKSIGRPLATYEIAKDIFDLLPLAKPKTPFGPKLEIS